MIAGLYEATRRLNGLATGNKIWLLTQGDCDGKVNEYLEILSQQNIHMCLREDAVRLTFYSNCTKALETLEPYWHKQIRYEGTCKELSNTQTLLTSLSDLLS
jgi:hypothetical protein